MIDGLLEGISATAHLLAKEVGDVIFQRECGSHTMMLSLPP